MERDSGHCRLTMGMRRRQRSLQCEMLWIRRGSRSRRSILLLRLRIRRTLMLHSQCRAVREFRLRRNLCQRFEIAAEDSPYFFGSMTRRFPLLCILYNMPSWFKRDTFAESRINCGGACGLYPRAIQGFGYENKEAMRCLVKAQAYLSGWIHWQWESSLARSQTGVSECSGLGR